MILTFLGPPRTATTSIFYALRSHSEISSSRVKEPLRHSRYRHLYPEKYLTEFQPNDKTKVLLDGTPCAYSFPSTRMIVDQIDMEKKIIYPLRNPFDRIYSSLKMEIARSKLYDIDLDYVQNNKFDVKKLLEWVRYMTDSRHILNANNRGDVLLFKFENLDPKNILNFLGVSPMELRFEKTNMAQEWHTKRFEEERNALNEVWQQNINSIVNIIYEDLKEIEHLIDVKDYIDDARKRRR
jgi:hypothetical protein